MHKRLGHPGRKVFDQVKRAIINSDFNSNYDGDDFCESCVIRRMTQLPYQEKSKQELDKQALGEMAIDISGPIRSLTMDGFKNPKRWY
jgi:hypothetical protein